MGGRKRKRLLTGNGDNAARQLDRNSIELTKQGADNA
jgi:hypothetical protein